VPRGLVTRVGTGQSKRRQAAGGLLECRLQCPHMPGNTLLRGGTLQTASAAISVEPLGIGPSKWLRRWFNGAMVYLVAQRAREPGAICE